MSQIKRLQTIDADTLQSTAYEPVSFVVDDLLPQGLHLLAGAPKIGKSWLALWLCLCAAQGKPLWTFATRPCEVLYLCLEDSFQRIQSRLFDLTEDAPPTLHFAVMSQQLHADEIRPQHHRCIPADAGGAVSHNRRHPPQQAPTDGAGKYALCTAQAQAPRKAHQRIHRAAIPLCGLRRTQRRQAQ